MHKREFQGAGTHSTTGKDKEAMSKGQRSRTYSCVTLKITPLTLPDNIPGHVQDQGPEMWSSCYSSREFLKRVSQGHIIFHLIWSLLSPAIHSAFQIISHCLSQRPSIPLNSLPCGSDNQPGRGKDKEAMSKGPRSRTYSCVTLKIAPLTLLDNIPGHVQDQERGYLQPTYFGNQSAAALC